MFQNIISLYSYLNELGSCLKQSKKLLDNTPEPPPGVPATALPWVWPEGRHQNLPSFSLNIIIPTSPSLVGLTTGLPRVCWERHIQSTLYIVYLKSTFKYIFRKLSSWHLVICSNDWHVFELSSKYAQTNIAVYNPGLFLITICWKVDNAQNGKYVHFDMLNWIYRALPDRDVSQPGNADHTGFISVNNES